MISAKIESEIAVLPPRRAARIFSTPSASTEPGLNRLIRAGYELLDLVTYFTVGPKEARAWTITRGTQARRRPPASSTPISSSGFIRAETIAYDDYVALGGEAGARDAGKLRLEGKDYVVARRRRDAFPLRDVTRRPREETFTQCQRNTRPVRSRPMSVRPLS